MPSDNPTYFTLEEAGWVATNGSASTSQGSWRNRTFDTTETQSNSGGWGVSGSGSGSGESWSGTSKTDRHTMSNFRHTYREEYDYQCSNAITYSADGSVSYSPDQVNNVSGSYSDRGNGYWKRSDWWNPSSGSGSGGGSGGGSSSSSSSSGDGGSSYSETVSYPGFYEGAYYGGGSAAGGGGGGGLIEYIGDIFIDGSGAGYVGMMMAGEGEGGTAATLERFAVDKALESFTEGTTDAKEIPFGDITQGRIRHNASQLCVCDESAIPNRATVSAPLDVASDESLDSMPRSDNQTVETAAQAATADGEDERWGPVKSLVGVAYAGFAGIGRVFTYSFRIIPGTSDFWRTRDEALQEMYDRSNIGGTGWQTTSKLGSHAAAGAIAAGLAARGTAAEAAAEGAGGPSNLPPDSMNPNISSPHNIPGNLPGPSDYAPPPPGLGPGSGRPLGPYDPPPTLNPLRGPYGPLGPRGGWWPPGGGTG